MSLLLAVATVDPGRVERFIENLEMLDPQPDETLFVGSHDALSKVGRPYKKIVTGWDLSYSRNVALIYGLRKGHELVWLCEDDVYFPRKDVIRLIKSSYKHSPSTCIFYGEQILVSKETVLDKNGILGVLAKAYRRGMVLKNWKNRGFDAFSVPAATLVINTKCLEKTGLFNQAFKLVSEFSEIEFIKRTMRISVPVKINHFRIIHYSGSKGFRKALNLVPQRLHNMLVYSLLARPALPWVLITAAGILLSPLLYARLTKRRAINSRNTAMPATTTRNTGLV